MNGVKHPEVNILIIEHRTEQDIRSTAILDYNRCPYSKSYAAQLQDICKLKDR